MRVRSFNVTHTINKIRTELAISQRHNNVGGKDLSRISRSTVTRETSSFVHIPTRTLLAWRETSSFLHNLELNQQEQKIF
jgi:hypothetical protein